MTDGRYRAFRAEDEPAFASLQAHAFGFSAQDAPTWFDRAGREWMRVWEVDGEPMGGLLIVPMGLFLCGHSVSTWGVAGVAVRPEGRGKGVGRAVMTAMLREAREAGQALSSLYASTRTLYRGVGYGLGGMQTVVRLPTDSMRGLASGSPSGWREATGADHEAMEALYGRRADHGMLDRGPYVWERRRRGRGGAASSWVRERNGDVVAYVMAVHGRTFPADTWSALTQVDWAAEGPADLQAVIDFIRGFRSIARTVEMPVRVADPLLDALAEARWETVFQEAHLVRVVDVVKALEGRGYGETQQGRVTLALVDPELPENAGTWTMEVEGGVGKVRRGGSDRDAIPLDIGTLAELLSGYTAPADLLRRGRINRWAPGLDLLSAPMPSILDFY